MSNRTVYQPPDKARDYVVICKYCHNPLYEMVTEPSIFKVVDQSCFRGIGHVPNPTTNSKMACHFCGHCFCFFNNDAGVYFLMESGNVCPDVKQVTKWLL